ncbi:speckle targeted PIP5K1A-regulated poly(A) polymerase-like [Neocloeon triangulifer]|uniref:speckle targeted PIP5K1A-regulated poly(A) polymerase-like n=1 Tax=Neocloeon triangulifer TaxID=2078957 RepID=UPI00286F4A85|nr:speckle targeted PIP5K1A-regulated poly(A) polymerase-like [Neocloeon triangulifer]
MEGPKVKNFIQEINVWRGKWCFECDQWVKNDRYPNPDPNQANDGQNNNFWKRHEASEEHRECKKTRGGFLKGKRWDGFTIVASVTDGQRNLEFREMCQAMRRHGYTTRLFLEEDVYIVTYRETWSAESALSSANFYNGRQISVKPMLSDIPARVAKPTVNMKDLQLNANESWEKQAEELAIAFKVLVTPAEIARDEQRVDRLLSDVRGVLREEFEDVRCFVFGSRVTGLVCIDSDVDIQVKLELTGTEFENMATDRDVHETLMRLCYRLFRKSKPYFTQILPIYSARIPVLHMLHKPTLLACDLTFKNMLAVQNSQFLRFIVSQDKRIFFFFLIVKLWKKARNLNFSTYSLTMLAIFYLQNLPRPMLPPILDLKVPSDSPMQKCNILDTPLKIESEISLKDLVVGFFKFLPNLDFGVEVVCPLLATTIEKWKFRQRETLPDVLKELADLNEHDCLQTGKPACVQDPFELNHNVVKGVSQRQLREFVSLCTKLAHLCDSNQKLGLKDLLNFTPSNKERKPNNQEFDYKIWLQDYLPSIELLQKTLIRELWFRDVVDAIYHIFTDVLTCHEVKNGDSQSDSGQPPSKMQKMPPARSDDLASWEFATPIILLTSRKKHNLTVNGCPFVKEFLITKVMTSQYYKDTSSIDEKFHLKFKLDVTSNRKPAFVNLHITNNGTALDTFRTLQRYVTQDLLALVNKTVLSPYKEELEKLNQCSSLEGQLEMFVVQNPESKPQPESGEGSIPKQTSTNPFLQAIEKFA